MEEEKDFRNGIRLAADIRDATAMLLKRKALEKEVRLLLLTAIAESAYWNGNVLEFRKKQIKGPAISVFQIEPPTLVEIAKFLKKSSKLRSGLAEVFRVAGYEKEEGEFLQGEFHYLLSSNLIAAAIARANYLRFPEPIPEGLWEQFSYYKKYWNTAQGKAKVETIARRWHHYRGAYILENIILF